MSTLSCRISFLAMDTSPSTVPLSSSTMNLTVAPPSLPSCSSRYIWKPLTMSVPSCVMMPVRGARNPILSSCACAGIDAPEALAAVTYRSSDIWGSLFIIPHSSEQSPDADACLLDTSLALINIDCGIPCHPQGGEHGMG